MILITNNLTTDELRLDIGQIQMEDYQKIQDYVQFVAMAYFHDAAQNRVRGSIDWFSFQKAEVGRAVRALAEKRNGLGKVIRSKEFCVMVRWFY